MKKYFYLLVFLFMLSGTSQAATGHPMHRPHRPNHAHHIKKVHHKKKHKVHVETGSLNKAK